MEKIKLYIDSIPFRRKPLKKDIQKINNRITNYIEEISVAELAQKQGNGYNVLPSLMIGNRKKENFISSQIIMLDFDNTIKENQQVIKHPNYISYEEMKQNPFVQQYASYLYKTHSYTDEINKYRVVFILDSIITDAIVYGQIVQYLLNLFPTADKACKDVARIFFGGNSYTEINFNNRLVIADCLTTTQEQLFNTLNDSAEQNQPEINTNSNTTTFNVNDREIFNTDYNENFVTKMIKEYDIEQYQRYLHEMNIHITDSFETKKDFVYLVNSIYPKHLFGIEEEGTFCCILTEDNNPSASVLKVSGTNLWEYVRFGHNDLRMTNIDVYKCLLKTNSLDKVINFLMRTFHVQYSVSQHLQHTHFILTSFIEHLSGENVLYETPKLNKVLGKHNAFIVDYLTYFLNNPFYIEEKNKTAYLSGKSANSLAEILFGTKSNFKRNYITKIQNLLSYLTVCNKLDFEQYPNYLKTILLQYKNQKNVSKINNVIQIEFNNELSFEEFILQIENSCDYLLSSGYTFKGFTQDFISMIDSVTDANELYKQTKNKSINQIHAKLLQDIEEILVNHFSTKEKLYILEKDIKKELTTKYHHSQSILKNEYNKSIHIVVAKLSLQRKKASKDFKAIFEIDANGYPYIITRI